MVSSQKIRVGLIGLNAPYESLPTGVNWAANAHLPYLRSSSRFELVALQNSSVERAKKSIKAYGLDPETVKAYGTPEDIANDPDVDLVVTSIRVDRHANSVIPSIKAGKDIFVEWPLEANYELSKKLADLAKTQNIRNVVGLQGSFAPLAKKVKALLENGAVGRVESSSIVSLAYGGPTVLSHVDYFIDRKIGGNIFTIAFGHSLEFILEVLGEVASHRSLLVNQYPEVSVVKPGSFEIIEESRKSDVPNQIVFDAVLKSGALLTYKLHNSATISPGAKPNKDKGRTPALDWRIFGQKGEIRITSYDTWSLNTGSLNLKLEVYKADDGVLAEVALDTDEFEALPLVARNIARLYEAFADGVDEAGEKSTWYPDFEHALKRHDLIEKMYNENGFASD